MPPLTRRDVIALQPSAWSPGADHWIRLHRTAMACRFEVALSGEHARHLADAREALNEADHVEAALTVFRETSDLMRVNRLAGDGPVAVGAPLFDLLCHCRDLFAATDGAFDVTSTPLSRCWGFLRREGRLPSIDDDEIDRARARVGMHEVELEPIGRTVRFRRPGMELNLGAYGKGYALDRMARLLRRRGVRHALLSAGGSSVRAMGGDRSTLLRTVSSSKGERSGWQVDLHSKQVRRDTLARVTLRDAALCTSGAGEQFVEIDGRRYGHVIDPRTGWPARGVLSATVVADTAAEADALSTALLVGGAELAERVCAARPQTLAVLVVEDDPDNLMVFGTHRGATLKETCS